LNAIDEATSGAVLSGAPCASKRRRRCVRQRRRRL